LPAHLLVLLLLHAVEDAQLLSKKLCLDAALNVEEVELQPRAAKPLCQQVIHKRGELHRLEGPKPLAISIGDELGGVAADGMQPDNEEAG
jgi:hypothetical protein